MNFNFTVSSIRIPSRWFDIPEGKKNTFQKMGGYKGFYLYLQLYKFRLHNQAKEHTFITSISLLRKETGYKTDVIFDLLKCLKSAKIITIAGVSRWEYLLDENKNPLEDKLLHISVKENESNPIYSGFDKKLDDFYIYVSFDLVEQYKKAKLDEKHFALHCLVQRYQRNGNCFMAIETMAEVLNIDKDTINRMIFNLNRNYFMVSWRRVNKKKQGEEKTSYRYEHVTYEEGKKYQDKDKTNWEGWLHRYKNDMDTITKRANRRAESKRKQREKVNGISKKSQTKIQATEKESQHIPSSNQIEDYPTNQMPFDEVNRIAEQNYNEQLQSEYWGEPDPTTDVIRPRKNKTEAEREAEKVF